MSARANGFTLIELLVSLAIFAMISVLLFGGFRFGLRAWESGSDRADRSAQVELVQNLLRRELAIAVVPRQQLRSDPLRQSPPLVGAADRLTFIGTMPVRADPGKYYTLTLTTHPSRTHTALTLTWTPFNPDARWGGGEPDETDLLLDDVTSIEFSYFGVYDPNRPADWVSEWADPAKLPQLVRLRVTFPAGDPRRWPDLVVALRLSR